LLNKKKDDRPTIMEVAKIPCIKAKIEEFIKEHNCKNEVISFFDSDPINVKSPTTKKITANPGY
jgi:predicted DNA-binding protein (UPF0278 family)